LPTRSHSLAVSCDPDESLPKITVASAASTLALVLAE